MFLLLHFAGNSFAPPRPACVNNVMKPRNVHRLGEDTDVSGAVAPCVYLIRY